MKKLILLFILTLFGMSCVVAQDNNPSQTTDLKAYVDSLSTKLNTLQHDYDYLYCSHEINQIQSELKDLLNDVNIKSNDIQRIKVGETDTYWIFVQNNSNKKITVNGIYIC